MRTLSRLIPIVFALAVPARADELRDDPADVEFFEKRVRPLLVQHCYECHSAKAKTLQGGLRLDSAHGVQRGGDSGPVVVTGQPRQSLLIDAIEYDVDSFQMPPQGKLSDRDIATLAEWVKRGALFPRSEETSPRQAAGIDIEAGRRFWSFQPVTRQPLPAVQDTSWPRERIDFFTLAAMEREQLLPSPEADRFTLLRRLSFDLTGLPPSPEELRRFAADSGPDAYEREVDRLLSSPAYGERWARMWLDLARYTDKTARWLYQTGQAHLYRDWVVQALQEDMPYDEFIHRQLATDLMPQTGPEDVPALGFLGLSPSYWKELKLPAEIIKVIVADEWEERVDAVSRTFLGLTVACARCHDHKFDPIRMQDYYALAGVFASCRMAERPTIAEELYEPVRLAKLEVETLEGKIAELRKQDPKPTEEIEKLSAQIDALKASTPQYDVPMANALAEESLYVIRKGKTAQEGTVLDYRPEPRDLNLFIRGNPNRPGAVVPRRFLEVLSDENSQPFLNGSGRLELAHALTSEAAALTARVIVNRIWLAHFGRGLVTTPSNFGQQGERPSHPELLDDLAARFVDSGWSLRWLHREIVLSATYRQSSRAASPDFERDPENRWLSRMNRRRLDVEAWRDAMLVVCDELDERVGGASMDLESDNNHRRTLYATVHRREMSTTLLTHDFPDPTSHSPARTNTTTPLQGLYALNGPLLAARSKALAERFLRSSSGDDASKINEAYWLLFAREPTRREVELGLAFLSNQSSHDRPATWTQYAHVLLISNDFLYVD
jgi:mono/diheme cytochrome c family protein